MGMGCQVATGILNQDGSGLTEKAERKFIEEVKDIVINGSENLTIPSPFPCGDPIPPNPNIDPEKFNLESKETYPDFHKNVIKGQYEKIANALNVESTFSLLPALADPIALAGSFGVEMPELSFPGGFAPYFGGLLVPKFAVDLLSAGVTDFFPPVKLIPELTKLIKVPTIPSIPLPPNVPFPPPIPGIPSPTLAVASPEGIGFPSAPQLPGVEFPPIPGIPNPLESFTDFVALQIAIAKGIPNLLTDMIAKIPSFLPKLGDPKAILAEICGMVRDSGIFGNIRPTSTVQAAATVVLARKTAECTLNAAFASTIGIAPGSAGCAINKQISGYDTIEKKIATKGPQSPAQRVVSYARQLVGVSAGQNGGEPYVSSVYFAEAAIAQMQKNSVNLLGEPIDPNNETTRQYSDPKKLIGVAWGENHTKFAPMEFPGGQYEYAKEMALEQSSCALFARACYYAGGFNSGFFLSLYPIGIAPLGLQFSFILRNYKWLKEDGTFDIDFYELLRTKLAIDNINFSVEGAASNKASKVIDGLELQAVHVGKDKSGKDKYEMRPVSYEDLTPYLKPADQRPYIGARELLAIMKKQHPDFPEFPAVNPGDIIYVRGENNNDHVSLVEQARPAGFEAGNSRTKLTKPFYCIDGGQVDPYNIGSGPEKKVTVEDASDLINAIAQPGNMVSDEILAKYPSGTIFIDGSGVKRQFTHASGTVADNKGVQIPRNYMTTEVKEDAVGKPTGILRVKRDLGAAVQSGKPHELGYYLGAERITLSNNNVTKVGDIRRITYLARADLLLDPKENEGIEAGIAAAAQDEISGIIWKRQLEDNGADPQRVWKCFPTVGGPAYRAALAKEKAKGGEKK